MEFLKKHLFPILTGVGIMAALLFFSLNVPHNREANIIERTILSGFSTLFEPAARAGNFVEDICDGYIRLVDTHKENLRLQDDIRKLNIRVLEGNEAVLTNKRLERLLDMKNRLKDPAVAATVIGEDTTPWFKSLIINRGSADGIREGMAVISADGIVGQTTKVSTSTSRVLLLTDNASGISAMIQRSRARGVVKGRGEMLCTLEFTTKEEDVKVGD
ncbi:MAG: rod shape-determining protein MreC, partial [Desulfuromonadaceae bacterium]|nr:rod shape-determining protein MreC [Desulfuromonadaceae bacterium]